MKKNIIISSFLSVAVALGAVSCKDEEKKGYLGDTDFVRFTQASAAIDEIAPAFPVLVSFTKKDGGTTADVTFAVEEVSAVAGVDYEILNTTNTLSFGAGEYIDTIWVRPLENNIACGPNRQLKIKLTEVSGGISAGFPNNGGASEFTLSIREVVALDIEAFANTEYSVEEFELDGTPYAGNPFDVSVALDLDRENSLAVINMGDWGSPFPAFLVFNPDVNNQVIQVLETPNGFGQGGVPLNWTGTGTYNVCTRQFTINYAFKNPSTNATLVPAINVFSPK
jgi:hypothetical protein